MKRIPESVKMYSCEEPKRADARSIRESAATREILGLAIPSASFCAPILAECRHPSQPLAGYPLRAAGRQMVAP